MIEGQLYWRFERPHSFVGILDGGIVCLVRHWCQDRTTVSYHYQSGGGFTLYDTLDEALKAGDREHTKVKEPTI